MTQREILVQTLFLSDHADLEKHVCEAVADELAAALKSEGLFIGPLRSTADMDLAAKLEPQAASDAWEAMVAEWQRGEGA